MIISGHIVSSGSANASASDSASQALINNFRAAVGEETNEAPSDLERRIGGVRNSMDLFYSRLDNHNDVEKSQLDNLVASGRLDNTGLVHAVQSNIEETQAIRGSYEQRFEALQNQASQIEAMEDPTTKAAATAVFNRNADALQAEFMQKSVGMAQSNLRNEIEQTLPVLDRFDAWLAQRIDDISSQTPEGGAMTSAQIQQILSLQYAQAASAKLREQLLDPASFTTALNPIGVDQQLSVEESTAMLAELDATAAQLDSLNNAFG